MGSRARKWSRGELLVAFALYDLLPFGQQHARNPKIVAAAKSLGRTPGSLAMKLNNLTSLDPEEAERGIRGLDGASRLDRAVWSEHVAGGEAFAAECERALQSALGEEGPDDAPDEKEEAWKGGTEKKAWRTSRDGQRYFRRIVRAAYEDRCCITGLSLPKLLIASHIAPWSSHPEHRVNPRNGLLLSSLHDAAFDKGLVTLDEDLRLVVGKAMRKHWGEEIVRVNFAPYEGRRISPPLRHEPDPALVQIHRKNRFAG
jgi:putative restriction endonuclease